MFATITSIYFGNFIVSQSDYFIELYYNSKRLNNQMIHGRTESPNESMDALVKEINHPLKKGHHFKFEDYLHWLDHTNSPHVAMSTTNTFIVVYVIIGMIISAFLKIVGLWVLLYCVNGAQKNWAKLEKRFLGQV